MIKGFSQTRTIQSAFEMCIHIIAQRGNSAMDQFNIWLKRAYSMETTYLMVGTTREIIGEPSNSSESTDPINFHGWPDSGKLLMITIYVWPCSSLRLPYIAMRTRASGLMNLYCPPVFRAVSGDFKTQNSLLHVQKQPVDKNLPNDQVHKSIFLLPKLYCKVS